MDECYFQSKSNTPPWVFFTFFKLYEWYKIAQSTTFVFCCSQTLTESSNKGLTYSYFHYFYFLKTSGSKDKLLSKYLTKTNFSFPATRVRKYVLPSRSMKQKHLISLLKIEQSVFRINKKLPKRRYLKLQKCL